MEITLEEIQKKFDDLPEDLKWAIMGVNVDDNIIEIGQTQGLNVEQMGQLSLETHMVMFGFTHPDKFEESIKNSMKLGDEKTRLIVNAVNEKILKEIKEKMMQMYDNTSKKDTTEHDTEEEKKKNTHVLNTAGIEIIPEKLELKKGEEVHPILAQKLNSTFQTPTVTTEHSLENLTKMSNQNDTIPQPPKPAPSTYPPKGDPYRLSPD
ncbi:MAG: hypothetical protein WC793_01915 [Candidatus Paceibacterota bacterium]|jgi:hypothetical protein